MEQYVFCQETRSPSGGWRKDKARPLIGSQCFDTGGLVTEGTFPYVLLWNNKVLLLL